MSPEFPELVHTVGDWYDEGQSPNQMHLLSRLNDRGGEIGIPEQRKKGWKINKFGEIQIR